jgi:hypothetical protein
MGLAADGTSTEEGVRLLSAARSGTKDLTGSVATRVAAGLRTPEGAEGAGPAAFPASDHTRSHPVDGAAVKIA